MDAARWREVDRIFAAALEKPPADRPAFLDAAGDGDSELRREVENLLAADERIGTFLERPAGQALGLASRLEAGGRLGPYRLLRPIGGGGMGTVYLARRDDEHYERLVAVKVLRSGLESTEAYQRFLAERQILARLDHPNVARLYDGGSTEDGRPFLVMELVEGMPVDLYCDRHRLTVDQRLALFRKICAAVQYAHQNLLVHRDIKPANVLVTAEGEPKLLDFGIAKRLEPEGTESRNLTRTGLRVMTPSYASPEQVRGEPITTASDVYSLGVLLYELLVGRSPYRLTSGFNYEIEAAICDQEPERPSQALFRDGAPSPGDVAAARNARPQALSRRLRGDLDNIAVTALRKEPQRRYGSVTLLSQDVESHLQNLPVAARQDTVLYRARKFVRRNRAAVVIAVAMVLLAAGFVVSLIAQSRRVARERDKARYALSFLVDTFKQADPYHTRGERLTARDILDQGTARVSRELAGQPDVQAAVMDAIGEANLGLGRNDEAEPLLERALALRRSVFGPESLEVAASLQHLAALKVERSDLERAESCLRQALAIRRRLLGNDDVEVAKTLNALGELLILRGKSVAEIEGILREGLDVARGAEGPAGATVAESILFLARAKQAAGDYAEAEKLFREGLDVERKALGDGDPRLYRHQTAFGEILIDMGKDPEAEAVLRRSLKAQRRILGGDHPDLAVTVGNLAMAVYQQDRFREAEVLNREALRLLRLHYGPDQHTVSMVLGNLALALQSQKKVSEAVPVLEEALEVRRQTLGEGHPLVAQALLLLAGAHRDLGNYPEALRLAQESLGILEKSEGPDHPHLAYPIREIGRIYVAQKRYAEAEPYLRRSLEIRRKELPARHPELAKAKVSLAECLLELGRLDEAATLLRETQETLAVKEDPNNWLVRRVRELLARIER